MNSCSRSGKPEPVLVAIFGERNAFDQLHHEERPALLGRAGVENLGDIGVIHQRQRLPLGLEPRQDGPGIHARLDQLERNLPLDRLGLLGQVDAAHAPFADLLAELVSTRDHRIEQLWPILVPVAPRVIAGGFASQRRRDGLFAAGIRKRALERLLEGDCGGPS